MSSGAGGGGGEAATEVKLFTRQELTTRNNKRDAVLIIHNSVYDVTKFLEEHPGGEEVLLERAGQDATEPFEDVGHSSDGRALMKKYKIGEVVAAERVESAPRDTHWADGSADEQRAAAGASGASAWVVPLVLGALATLLYRYLFL